ncbi:MAG TPA: alkyl sulfatase dimerization domain-containing protein [Blastocatellia bacterium]|nr:alkyl sulfatase dimerization domain-containing protein [Blastocatellia bacterium]HMV84361.1 alkyl sulfatase dimerization domain-containing protein [Blastocatellia bacterium]HMX29748.1 alkyl sulfatase dimerization domain-containing protein [Blastocatellia bacterium]HMY74562.1 alkyl sulfatase dimerization domain-containing protein [Blastocatellia bacterium]HMZ18310.1 alkyl sulfatase dimerization domain-containing protein [Blastocatellia bacterium]
MKLSRRFAALFSLLLLWPARLSAQQDQIPVNPITAIRVGQDQKKALKVNDDIFQAIGFSNTFLVKTSEGNVIIDTSMPFNSALHKRLLTAESVGPIKYIILTHAHGDHIGGLAAWKQPGTQIIAQKNHSEFQHYMARLNGFYGLRNAAQFALPIPATAPAWPGNYGAKIEPTILFDDKYEFELGGVKFVVMSTPGETYDHATVWIPKYKAAFVGDNYYDSFPNIYTLRGTQPRWALDYVNSLNKVLELKPEIMLPSHGLPVTGNAEITKRVTQYRDAIQFVHDETVKGMNAGKDVWTLMNEIKLPAALDIGESYGKLSWSVRGIYEGYVGWFDLNPAAMYEKPVSSVYADVVKLAGGAEAVAKLAMERAQAGLAVEALHLGDIALAAEATNKTALSAKLRALETLRERCRNSNERGWLDFSISQLKLKLSEKK